MDGEITPGNPDATPGNTPNGTDVGEESVNAITDLLHGKQMQYRVYRDLKTGQEVRKMNPSNFLNILLNVQSESDIYNAWEKEHRDTVEEYEHTKGEPTVKLNITNWI